MTRTPDGDPRDSRQFFGPFFKKIAREKNFFFEKKKQKTFVTLACALGLAFVASGPVWAAPALWLVQGAHTKIYLFGTMHILPKPAPWFTGKVQKAFNESGTLWEEADVGLGNSGASAGFMRQGVDTSSDLWTALPRDTAETFRGELKKCGISPELVANYRPWLAALMPTICDIMAQTSGDTKSAPAANGPEAVLIKAAHAGDKQVAFFETVAEQIGFLANAPYDAQMQQLKKAIEEAATGKDDFSGLETAWANGDVAAIAKAVLQMRSEGEAFYQTILAKRNVRFAARIKQMLDGSGTVFVAIGAAHLAGPDSIQAELAKQGITAQLQ
jgi:uncharacterized protein YbaP (TraB family)